MYRTSAVGVKACGIDWLHAPSDTLQNDRVAIFGYLSPSESF